MGKNKHNHEKMQEIRSALHGHQVLIAWKPEYELEIPILDEHHRAIVATINSLHHALQNKHDESVLAPIVGMIHEYTRIHFEIEEGYLGKINFPEMKHHHSLHIELLHKLSETGNKSIWDQDAQRFMAFLKNWWIDHICTEDLVFRDYLLTMNGG
ncbi:MAG: bacteriohemerythrin [Planctomycetes bacterium]|nr:bacteriohemerythrin [Planctomycetota bacterium]